MEVAPYVFLLLETLFVVGRCVLSVLVYMLRLVVPASRKSLRDKHVLVTGAGHGLGREIALRCAQVGAKLILLDINKENNDAVCEELRQLGYEAHAFQCDVTSEQQVEAVGDQILKTVGPVDVLVNNAGIAMCKGLLTLKHSDIRRTFDVNTLSQFWMVKYFLPSMKDRGSGHIVCIASVAGLLGSPFMTDYCASKFAALGFMYALEEELFHTGFEFIKLTTVCPVFINTGLFPNVGARFPLLTPIMDTRDVAYRVVDAIQRDESLIVVPRIVEIMYKCLKPLPEDAQKLIQRFLACSIQKPSA
ncbi:17-beta-hydroxysteroid dehydrogenase 13-like [Dermacentor variabilis]|uniref:17-beta-hydroxysteroid dehydrogenase 13-like n=1 Tax=Dermacentor variabilis TaxID=34621 RepID=UPI003F5C0177